MINWILDIFFPRQPCPLCRKKMTKETWHLQTDPGGGMTICINCKEQAEVINQANYKRWGWK